MRKVLAGALIVLAGLFMLSTPHVLAGCYPDNNNPPCEADLDFDCDVDVDGTDAAKFKEDFGRGQHENPCPCCPRDPWCTYP